MLWPQASGHVTFAATTTVLTHPVCRAHYSTPLYMNMNHPHIQIFLVYAAYKEIRRGDDVAL